MVNGGFHPCSTRAILFYFLSDLPFELLTLVSGASTSSSRGNSRIDARGAIVKPERTGRPLYWEEASLSGGTLIQSGNSKWMLAPHGAML